MRSVKVQIFIVCCLLVAFSCKKKDAYPIPSVPFDFTIDLSLPSYQDLNGTGGWAYVNGGIKGIIVYRQSYDVFVAWERQSPEDPENSCSSGLVTNADNFLQLDDPCSDARFSLYDGSALANSKWGLRKYQASWDGSNLVRLYN